MSTGGTAKRDGENRALWWRGEREKQMTRRIRGPDSRPTESRSGTNRPNRRCNERDSRHRPNQRRVPLVEELVVRFEVADTLNSGPEEREQPNDKVIVCKKESQAPRLLSPEGRYRETCGTKLGGRGLQPGALQELHAKAGAPDALSAQSNRRRLKMCPGGVDIGCVAKTELDVDRRSNPDELRDLVQADEAADVVGRLHVDVERDVDGRADRRHLLNERSVGRLSVLAPSSSRTRAVAGLATGSITEIFACISEGNSPCSRMDLKIERTPRSAMRTLRNPCSAARLMSSRT